MKTFRSLKRFFFALIIPGIFFVGILLGYQLHEEGVAHGCFPLEEDLPIVSIQVEKNGVVKFGVIGDTGTANLDKQEVADSLSKICRKDGCDLILMLGDNFYPEGLKTLEDPLFTKAFLDIYRELKIPFFPVLGNHDVKGNVQAQLYQSRFHRFWSMPNYSYSFETGPVRFHAINTNCHLNAWYRLYQSFDEPSMDNSGKPWNIVFGHHPIYSQGGHGDTDLVQQFIWNELFEQKVDFYLSGHDHHLNAMRKGDSGPYYLVSGAGGAHYRDRQDIKDFSTSNAESLFVHRDTGFLWMEIHEASATFRFYDKAGDLLYEKQHEQQD